MGCLRRLRVVRPTGLFELLAAVEVLRFELGHRPAVVVVDGMGSFFWQDKVTPWLMLLLIELPVTCSRRREESYGRFLVEVRRATLLLCLMLGGSCIEREATVAILMVMAVVMKVYLGVTTHRVQSHQQCVLCAGENDAFFLSRCIAHCTPN